MMTRHQGCQVVIPMIPKVFVFANVLPNVKRASADRWSDVYHLFDKEQEPKHMTIEEIRNQRRIRRSHRKRQEQAVTRSDSDDVPDVKESVIDTTEVTITSPPPTPNVTIYNTTILYKSQPQYFNQ